MNDPRIDNAIRQWDLYEFLDEYSVEYKLEGKNIGVNYIGVEECPFCFTGDNLVLTNEGMIPIEKIKQYEDITVLTKSGVFYPIGTFWERKLNRDNLIEYYAFGMVKPAIGTVNHEIFCAERVSGKHIGGHIEKITKNCKQKQYKTWFKGEIPLGELTGNAYINKELWVKLPEVKTTINKIIFDAYFLGLYCADGSIGKDRELNFHLNTTTKKHIAKKIISFFGKGVISTTKNTERYNVHIYSKKLTTRFEKLCGRGSHNKKVPMNILLNSNEWVLKEFLRGYFDGDGCTQGTLKSASTTSMHLGMQISILLRRLDFAASVTSYTPKKKYADGIVRKEHCTITYNTEPTKNHPNIRFINGEWYGRIKSIKRLRGKTTKVYNLTIKNDHTYTINGSVVKNCGKGNFHFAIHKESKYGTCFVCKGFANAVRLIAIYGHMTFKKAEKYLIDQAEESLDIVERVQNVLRHKQRKETYEKDKSDKIPDSKRITYSDLKRNNVLREFFINRKLHLWHCHWYDLRLGYGTNFKDKIIWPIYYGGKIVTYQWRRLSKKQYHNPTNLGTHLLNEEGIIENKPLIIVEGFLDYTRIDSYIRCYHQGEYAVASGLVKSVSAKQISKIINGKPSRIITIFDRDSWFDYTRLQNEIPFTVDFEILPHGKDPNDLSWIELSDLFKKF